MSPVTIANARRYPASADHHARILNALEARDASETHRLMEHHLAESGELAVGILQEMGTGTAIPMTPWKRRGPVRHSTRGPLVRMLTCTAA